MLLPVTVEDQAAIGSRMLARAHELVDQQRAPEALPLIERLRSLPQLGAGVLHARARAMLALGRFKEAEQSAGEALAMGSAAGPLLKLRGRARMALGAQTGALDDAAAAVMADSSDMSAQALLADMLLKAGKFDEAIFLLGRVLDAAPDKFGTQMRLAQAFMLAARYATADELLSHIESRAPSIAAVAALRGQSKLLAGDALAAERIVREALLRGTADASTYSVLAHALVAQGRLADAGPHFRTASRLAPHDSYLAHLANASNGNATARAGDNYVSTVFDGYAARFEAELLAMGYRVPGLIRLEIERILGASGQVDGIPGPVLDLGCGTGLVGVTLLDLTQRGLCGIDLSDRMLQEAKAKGIYTELRHAEVCAALAEDTTAYALITAADVFCYFGTLDEVINLAGQRLAADGLLIFSVEQLVEGGSWQLGASGRYRHSADYVRRTLAQAGLIPVQCREETLRLDGNKPVEGLFVVARRIVN